MAPLVRRPSRSPSRSRSNLLVARGRAAAVGLSHGGDGWWSSSEDTACRASGVVSRPRVGDVLECWGWMQLQCGVPATRIPMIRVQRRRDAVQPSHRPSVEITAKCPPSPMTRALKCRATLNCELRIANWGNTCACIHLILTLRPRSARSSPSRGRGASELERRGEVEGSILTPYRISLTDREGEGERRLLPWPGASANWTRHDSTVALRCVPYHKSSCSAVGTYCIAATMTAT